MVFILGVCDCIRFVLRVDSTVVDTLFACVVARNQGRALSMQDSPIETRMIYGIQTAVVQQQKQRPQSAAGSPPPPHLRGEGGRENSQLKAQSVREAASHHYSHYRLATSTAYPSASYPTHLQGVAHITAASSSIATIR
jgi:hypothetical protein